VNEEFRAITKNDLTRLKAVMMSSTSPSAKYSCSGSPLMLVNGRTAMDGLSGSGNGLGRSGSRPATACDAFSDDSRYALTGSAMFLTACGPRSEKRSVGSLRTYS
jgi:hypothetical protein